MKKLMLLTAISLFTLYSFGQQTFEVITKNPAQGAELSFEYMPRNTVLQGKKDFTATAYLLEGALPLAKEIKLQQDGGIYRGTVKTNDTTKAVFFAFDKEQLRDNNNDLGYYTFLYDKNGNVVMGSRQAVAGAFASYGGIWGLKRDAQKAAPLYKEEYADVATRDKYFFDWLTYLGQGDETSKALLKEELIKKTAAANSTEADLQRIKGMYQYTLKDKEQTAATDALLKQKFPQGKWKKLEAADQLYKTKDPAEREKLFTTYVATYGGGKDEESNIGFMAGNIASAYANTNKFAEADIYLAMVKDRAYKANSLNSIAWKLAGEGITKTPVDVKTGLKYSAQSLALMEEEMKTPAAKPPYYTEKQYINNLKGTYYNFVDTYATLLYQNGDYKNAYAKEKEAVEFFKRESSDINEAYALLTEKIMGAKAAQTELESFYESGKYTTGMKEQLKRLYLANGKTEAQWASYSTNLEQQAFNKIKEEIAKTMINMPAPQFALKDMSGKEVSLASLKGKVVVVDFWATWCGPCVASFPGMQMAVNKYKNNPNVAFLFVDTWENDSNRVEKVTGFIAKNKYNFNVLYDDPKTKEGSEFVVVENYKVEGIPTKFVIDGNNNIRFKTVGYSGSADALVNELTAMIEMAGESSGAVKKGF